MSKERQLLHRAATYLQNDCSDGAEKLRAEIKSYLAEPEAEPIATVTENDGESFTIDWDSLRLDELTVGTDLYTHPPRQPVQLSDDEIIRIFSRTGWEVLPISTSEELIECARAVIAAYEEKQNGQRTA